jgi:CHRD domain
MRRSAAMLPLSAALLFALGDRGSAQEEKSERDHVKSERLLGGNENPPVISDGSGNFRAQLRSDRISFELRYDVESDMSDVTQAHLHIANPGDNGGIVVFLCSNPPIVPPEGVTQRECPPSPGEVSGEIVAEDVLAVVEGEPPDQTEMIAAGDLAGLMRLIEQSAVYANVHTDDHPGGEVRGQMEPRRR